MSEQGGFTDRVRARWDAAARPTRKSTALPPRPGWVEDVDRPGVLVYWTGEDYDYSVPPRPKPEPLWKRARVVALGILIALAVVFVLNRLSQPSDLDCAIQELEVLQGDRVAVESACVGRG